MSAATPAPILLEVATGSPAGCRAAERGGAHRIELCGSIGEGGTTPSAGTIERAIAATSLPVLVLLRPRAGDFLYDEEEFAILRRDLDLAGRAGAAGVVFGLLESNGAVDAERTRELVQLARPMQVTFHRAFDLSQDLFESIETLAQIGVDRVLTSGGAPTAAEGATTIAELVRRARGRLAILAGGGVRPENAVDLVERAGVRELHFSARRPGASPMRFRRESIRMGAEKVPGEYERYEPDVERVRAMAALFPAALAPGSIRPY